MAIDFTFTTAQRELQLQSRKFARDVLAGAIACETLATPEEPNESWSGFAWASAISSLTVLTPSEGWTTKMLGVVVSRTIGTRLWAKSNLSLG